MVSGLESLHKILKDETRRKILLLLDERGSLSYTDLMNALGIASTGKLNYHLKILNELIVKDGDGLYSLSEKGKLAIRLLEEFCQKKSQAELEAPFPKGYMTVAVLFEVTLLCVIFGLHVAGLVTVERYLLLIVTSILGIVFLWFSEKVRMRRAMMTPEKQMLGAKISIILAAATAGAVITFFGAGLLLVGIYRVGVGYLMPFNWFIVVTNIVGSIVGCLVGYWIYKKSRFSKKSYYDPFAQ